MKNIKVKKLVAALCTAVMVTSLLGTSCFAAPKDKKEKKRDEEEVVEETDEENTEEAEEAKKDEEKAERREKKDKKASKEDEEKISKEDREDKKDREDKEDKEEAEEEDEDEEEPEIAEWTVLAYICGTDLESQGGMATVNLREIASTVPNDSVNVVVQGGGTRQWQCEDLGLELNPKKTSRFTYDDDGFKVVDELPLKNMASGKTLADFISWGTKEYPAKKYMLVMWDHGGGSETGLIVDEYYGDAVMPIYDFEKALDESDADLEAVVVDCCLMATLEMAQSLEGHSKYLIASEEIEPGQGNAWDGWLQYLYDDPECSGSEVGKVVCNKTQQKYVELNDDMSSTILTQSVIDIDKIPAVGRAFDAFFTKLCDVIKDPAEYRKYKVATDKAEHYCQKELGMVDLVDLSDKAKKSGVMNSEAIKLHKTVEDAVVYSTKGKGRSYSHGLSYFDGTGADTTFRQLDHYSRTAKSAPYLAYLDAVKVSWTAPDWVYDEVDPVEGLEYENYGVDTELNINEDGELELKVIEGYDAITAIDYRLYKWEDDEWNKLGEGIKIGDRKKEDSIFTAVFDGTWPAIDGVFCSMNIQDEAESYTRYLTPVYISDVDEDVYSGDFNPEDILGQTLDIESAYLMPEENPEDEEASDEGYYEIYGFSKGYMFTENSDLPDRGTYSLNSMRGVKCRMLYPEVDEYTGNSTFKGGEEFEISNKIKMELKELPEGEYGYSFTVTDLLGHVTETEIVRIKWDGKKAAYSFDSEEAEEAEEEAEEED